MTSMFGVDSSDGITPVAAEITAATKRLRVDSLLRGEHDTFKQDASTESLVVSTHVEESINDGNHYYLEGHAELASAAVLRVKLVTPDTTKWGRFIWDIGSSGVLTTEFYEGASGGMGSGSRAVIHANNRNINCWSGKHTGGNDEATVLTDSNQAWIADELIGMQVFNETDGSSAFITDNTTTTVTVAALAGGTGNDWDTNDKYEINNSQMVIEKAVDAATDAGVLISSSSWGSRSAGGGGQSRMDEIVPKQNTTYYRTFTSGAANNIVFFKASWHEHIDLN